VKASFETGLSLHRLTYAQGLKPGSFKLWVSTGFNLYSPHGAGGQLAAPRVARHAVAVPLRREHPPPGAPITTRISSQLYRAIHSFCISILYVTCVKRVFINVTCVIQRHQQRLKCTGSRERGRETKTCVIYANPIPPTCRKSFSVSSTMSTRSCARPSGYSPDFLPTHP
jgi:hypothetical protein